MFRLFCSASLQSNFILCHLQVADFPRDLNFKFNREVEISKRQNLDFARYRSAFKFKINSKAAQCGKNSSAENSAVQAAQNEAATACGVIAAPPKDGSVYIVKATQ